MPVALILALLAQLQLPAPTGYVNDFAGVIDAASRAAMEAVIDRVHAASGGEIVVVTLKDIGGRAPIDVARDIGRQWKVGAQGAAGDPRRNTGTIILLVPGVRPGDGKAQLAIATGSGAEGFVTDALAGRIRDEVGRQAVSAGSYAAGLVAGVQLLGAAYAKEFGFDLGAAAPPADTSSAQPRHGGGLVVNLLFLVMVFAVLGILGRRRGGGGGWWGGGGGSGLLQGIILGSLMSGGRRGGWGGGGFGGGGFGGFGGGGGGFGGFGGGGGFSGGGASGGF